MMENKYPTCNAPREDTTGGHFLSEEHSFKTTHLMSEKEMDVIVGEMAKKIVEEHGDCEGLVLVGVKSRGTPIAKWVAKKIEGFGGKPLPVGSLDINLYRDDLTEIDYKPVIHKTELPFSIAGKGIILVDDVLYTGRTVRAALDALVDFGRPKFIKLAVLIDRGFREFPIQADYTGKKIKTTFQQNVKVMLTETDGKNEVLIIG